MLFKKGFKAEDLKQLDKQEVRYIIDIREGYETSTGMIKGSKNIPMNKLLANPQNYIKPGNTYYIMCQSGMRSKMTCNKLKKAGYTNIENVKGGYARYCR